MYTAIDLSKYIVTKCAADGCPLSNLQLQKILYYVQREYLKRGELAFSDSIEAWQFGPVVPNVYYKFCGFGAMPITRRFADFEAGIKVRDLNLIDQIVEKKRCLDPWEMVAETHRPGGAWDKTYRNGLGTRQVIQPELIKAEG